MASKAPVLRLPRKIRTLFLPTYFVRSMDSASRSQAFPAALPKLESGLGADQEFTDREGELRKVADRLAVIFNSNFESALTCLPLQRPAPRDKEPK